MTKWFVFCRYWCLKEAYVKAIGSGVGLGLERLEFHHNNWSDIYVKFDGKRSHDWRFWMTDFGERQCVSTRAISLLLSVFNSICLLPSYMHSH